MDRIKASYKILFIGSKKIRKTEAFGSFWVIFSVLKIQESAEICWENHISPESALWEKNLKKHDLFLL